MSFRHVPVLLEEAVTAWRGALAPRGFYVDCTLGGAGHTTRLLCLQQGARVLGIDKDPAAIAAATSHLQYLGLGERAHVVRGCYTSLPRILENANTFPQEINGILADLGVSSPQLDEAERGFSLQRDGPLDMRFSSSLPTETPTVTASDLINVLTEAEIASIFRDFGEEPCAAAAARAVVSRRRTRPFETTLDLAHVIGDAVRATQRVKFRHATQSSAHPATRCFQALRIAVNGEMGAVSRLLADAPALLAPGGRLVVITFHSLEDRLVKRAFEALCGGAPGRSGKRSTSFRHVLFGPGTVGRRFLVAGDDEIVANPRSRTAKLRAIERVVSPSPV